MGYDLSNQKTKEDFRWTEFFWVKVLKLAEKNGWRAKGTTIPRDYDRPDWDGNYYYNSGEIVEAEDALNLAEALTKSLATLPKEDIPLPKPNTKEYDQIPLEQFFSGSNGRKSLEDFIAFCRKGSFEIG